ncbi:hypothetical protein, partial [Sphingomonas sp. KC8]|uniref:hypothetical protein n=1 Tax=Sphingomonas sp. KC8 TaxID=1030157 RepID=UPI00055F542D
MRYIGEDVGKGMAAMATRYTPAAIREAIENVRAAGADELLICPATAHYNEVDRLAELIG